jgi:hypothetical protein
VCSSYLPDTPGGVIAAVEVRAGESQPGAALQQLAY